AINDIGTPETPMENLWARASVLSAVRLPDSCRSFVSGTYAGVSTFKVILDCLSGTPQKPQPEISYWTWHNSRSVIELTGDLRTFEAARG
ncbi:MAG: hypothetical protein VCC04_06790, partial [Myxococcota bacterium]